MQEDFGGRHMLSPSNSLPVNPSTTQGTAQNVKSAIFCSHLMRTRKLIEAPRSTSNKAETFIYQNNANLFTLHLIKWKWSSRFLVGLRGRAVGGGRSSLECTDKSDWLYINSMELALATVLPEVTRRKSLMTWCILTS